MSRYRVIRTIDLMDLDEIGMDEIPYWFDSEISWDVFDFIIPELYKSVEIIIVEF